MEEKIYRSLVINPGSTSTKIGVFNNDRLLFETTLRHSAGDLAPFADILDQFEFRKQEIDKTLRDNNFDPRKLDFIMARGGSLRPLASGVYSINGKMLDDLRNASSKHASNLAALIADSYSRELGGIPAFIADPIVVDEMQDVARIAGHPLFSRKSIFHALNQKATARRYAREIGKPYENLNLIVAHMGGGISVAAHRAGRVIDVNQAIDGEGPFSPERSGSLPVGQVIDICFSGKYRQQEIRSMVNGKGGLMAYLGSSDARDARRLAEEGDKKADLIVEAMAYQIAKEIGAMGTVLMGNIDAILLTGGIAYNDFVMGKLIPRIEFIAPVTVYPGEDELTALATNGLMVMQGEVSPKEY